MKDAENKDSVEETIWKGKSGCVLAKELDIVGFYVAGPLWWMRNAFLAAVTVPGSMSIPTSFSRLRYWSIKRAPNAISTSNLQANTSFTNAKIRKNSWSLNLSELVSP